MTHPLRSTGVKAAPVAGPKPAAPAAKAPEKESLVSQWTYKVGGATHYPHLGYELAHLNKYGHHALHAAEHWLAHGGKLGRLGRIGAAARLGGRIMGRLPIIGAVLSPAIAYYDLKGLVKMSKDPTATKAQKVGQAFMAVGSTVGAALSVVGIGLAIGAGMAAAGPVLAIGGTIALAGFGVGWAIKKFF